MTAPDVTARQEAIAWAVRTHDAAFEDWEGLERWLAADPEHARLYDRVTRAVDEAAKAPRHDDIGPAIPVPAGRLSSPAARWIPFAMAASVVVTVGGVAWMMASDNKPASYALSTQPGVRRSVVLDKAVRLEVNGDTRLTLDRRDARFARMERGEVLLSVAHDPEHPFRLEAGDVTITDIGTIFDVEQNAQTTRIAVADGEVRVTTRAGSATVPAGRGISIAQATGDMVLQDVEKRSVGAWRVGRIDFTDMAIADLAIRLHRATGAQIDVARDIADRRVSGSIAIGTDPQEIFRTLAPLLRVAIVRRGDLWVWSGHAGTGSS